VPSTPSPPRPGSGSTSAPPVRRRSPTSSRRPDGWWPRPPGSPGSRPLYATLELDDGTYLYAFSEEERARALARRFGAEVGYFPEPAAIAEGLPGVRGLLLDFDPETEEAYRVRWEEL